MGAKQTTASPSSDLSKTVEMNEALVLGSVRQHELAEAAEKLNAQLQAEIAERKQAEDALRRARDYAENIVASVRVPLVVLDAALRVRTASRVFCEHFRVALAETEGRLIYDLGNRQWDIPALRTLLEEVLPEKNEIANYEVRHTFEQLGPRIILLNACRLAQVPDAEPLVILSLEDITAREAAGAALEESDEQFRAIADNIPQLAWLANAEPRVIWFNKVWLDYTGTTVEENVGDGWKRAHHPDHLAAVAEKFERALREGLDWEDTFPLRRHDGEYRWFLSRMKVIRDEAGEVVRFFGTNTDITERRAAEEALRASEERYRGIIDSSPDCIKVLDLEGRLLSMEAGQEMLGITDLAPLLGTSWLDFWVREEDRAGARGAIAAAALGGEGKFVGFYRTPHGEDIWWDVAVTPVRDASGRPARLLAVSRDVTERQAMEAMLVARAAELAQADRSKDEFLAMLAHELRNPLAPLRNAAEILQSAGVSAEERAQAQRIIGRQIENMSHMIDDLLDVSRITEGKITLRKKAVSLEAVLTAATSLARSGCAAHHQELTITLPAEPVWLNADATRLEQVFNNLLGNACKYSGDGCHIALHAEVVEAEAGATSSSYSPSPSSSSGTTGSEDRAGVGGRGRGRGDAREILITVTDDGIGIDPELLPRVFDLFVQASRTLDRAHGGLGIGLTLVQRLVKLHGGSIQARSEGLGHGAQFIVRLPILAEAPPPAPLPPAPAARDIPRRILIVDDNTDSARSLAILQTRRGHITQTAFTGPDAVTAAAEFLPEVVLLDIGLPGMDGFEVARQIRAMPALSKVFIIAMSGYGRDEDRAEAKLAGFDEYLVKPVDLEQLRTWLRERGEK